MVVSFLHFFKLMLLLLQHFWVYHSCDYIAQSPTMYMYNAICVETPNTSIEAIYKCTCYLNISGKGVEVAQLCNLFCLSIVNQNFSEGDLFIFSWERYLLWNKLVIVSLSKIVSSQNFRIFLWLWFQKSQVFLSFPLDHISWLVTNHSASCSIWRPENSRALCGNQQNW